MKTDYTGITGFLKAVETLNKKAVGDKEGKEYPNTERANQISEYAKWYRKQNPRASERQVSRAIDRKFWSK